MSGPVQEDPYGPHKGPHGPIWAHKGAYGPQPGPGPNPARAFVLGIPGTFACARHKLFMFGMEERIMEKLQGFGNNKFQIDLLDMLTGLLDFKNFEIKSRGQQIKPRA